MKIHNNQIDLILQVEDSVSINKVLNRLTLETDNILLVTTELFFSRFMIFMYEENCVDDAKLHDVEDALNEDRSTVEVNITYKGKSFTFYIIIWKEDHRTIGSPIKGPQTFKLGFREIKL